MAICKACGSTEAASEVGSVRGIWKKDYPVAACRRCGLYFLPLTPTAADLAELYRHHYYAYTPLSLAVKVMFRRFRSASQQAYIERFIPMQGLKVLEIGCGEGSFLHFCQRRGAIVAGTEYSAAMRDYALKHYRIELSDRDFFQLEGRYDLIAMSHSLEHFLDVAAVLAKAKSLLKPGGALFAELPNSPLGGEVAPEVLAHYLNTVHIYNFTAGSLRQLFETQGFTVTNLGRYMPQLPFKPSAAMRYLINDKLQHGHRPPLPSYLYLAGYILGSLLGYGAAYSEVRDLGWTYNDNLRIIATTAS